MAAILVTDDDDELRGVVRAALESAGHQVAEASDGSEALRHIEHHQPDLVITDMHMLLEPVDLALRGPKADGR